MTVAELIKELKQYPKDGNVVLVADWEKTDEDGRLTDCIMVENTSSQTWFDDSGFSRDYTEVIIY